MALFVRFVAELVQLLIAGLDAISFDHPAMDLLRTTIHESKNLMTNNLNAFFLDLHRHQAVFASKNRGDWCKLKKCLELLTLLVGPRNIQNGRLPN